MTDKPNTQPPHYILSRIKKSASGANYAIIQGCHYFNDNLENIISAIKENLRGQDNAEMSWSDIAAKWRIGQPTTQQYTGVVLIQNTTVVDWAESLPSAHQIKPDTVAIDEYGRTFICEAGERATSRAWVVV